MAVDALVLATIVAMALATYATRAGGFWLMRWVPMTRRTEAWLRHIPGAVLIALIAPRLVDGGVPDWAGAAAALAAMLLVRHDLAALGAGIATVALLRQLL